MNRTVDDVETVFTALNQVTDFADIGWRNFVSGTREGIDAAYFLN
jgi:hypothetical protein